MDDEVTTATPGELSAHPSCPASNTNASLSLIPCAVPVHEACNGLPPPEATPSHDRSVIPEQVSQAPDSGVMLEADGGALVVAAVATVAANSTRRPSNQRKQEGAAAASRVLRKLRTSTARLSVIALDFPARDATAWWRRVGTYAGENDEALRQDRACATPST